MNAKENSEMAFSASENGAKSCSTRDVDRTSSLRACEAVEALLALRERVSLGTAPHGGGELAAQIGKHFGVNRAYVYDALKICEQAPEIFSQVQKGLIGVRKAKRLMESSSARKNRSPSAARKHCRRTSCDITRSFNSNAAEIVESDDGYRMFVTGSWRNQLAQAMADERKFEKALRGRLVITLEDRVDE